ncbi:ethanolamine utilization protein EutJ [Irregularibacter muris]|jgi:ethanolamine utilization protein EutJ|uniref:Ethanolamine utilization protein EutJ n=1 Tax=Irregularibacter muris TaxID=1796619 RepID=A0AAE3HDH7_9FIRM|nr:ethanolamine utilization protein EutJ [Irregularibacter muris]MCR1898392.1 ethanolamine utilization protein EutJ [Irregularibacter muris]
MDLKETNKQIKDFETLIKTQQHHPYTGELYTGVDLGTSSIVLCVLDQESRIIAGAFERAKVVKDGIIVDFIGAIEVVRRLKAQLEKQLGVHLIKAAGAIPPGVAESSQKIVTNVLEACDFQVVNMVDEPSAAAKLLKIQEGAVVDIGGGTTGISQLQKGKVVFTHDEATGGHHMNLVISGRYHVDYDQAEKIKCSQERAREILATLLPVIDKMANIVKNSIGNKGVKEIYLVGGGSQIQGFEQHFQKDLGLPIIKPYNPMLVTPLGIALSAVEGN